MKIQIVNAPWYKQATVHSAILYMSRKLSGFSKRGLKLQIVFVRGYRNRTGSIGEAHRKTDRSYRIKIDAGLKPLALLRCLSHELIHVEQWLTKKMVDLNWYRSHVKWRRRIYRPSKTPYSRQPWEIEARKYEWYVAQSFIDFWKKQK